MSTLIEQLKKDVEELEPRLGSEHPFVKDLKEQLRASEANAGNSTEEVFRMQAVPTTEADDPNLGKLRIAKFQHQNAEFARLSSEAKKS